MHRYKLPAVSTNYPPTRGDAPMAETVFDGDADLEAEDEGEIIPYAHRDIKPA